MFKTEHAPTSEAVRRVMGLVIGTGVLPLSTSATSVTFNLAAVTKALYGDADVQRALDAEGATTPWPSAAALNAVEAACTLCRLQPQEHALAELRSVLLSGAVLPSAFGLRAFVEAARQGHVLVLRELLAHPRTRRNFELGRPLETSRAFSAPDGQRVFVNFPFVALHRALNDVCALDTLPRLSMPFAAVIPSSETLELNRFADAQTIEQADEPLARVFTEMLRVPLFARGLMVEPLFHVLCKFGYARALGVLLEYEPRLARIHWIRRLVELQHGLAEDRIADVVDVIVCALLRIKDAPARDSDILSAAINGFVKDYAGSPLIDVADYARENARITCANAIALRVSTNPGVLARESPKALVRLVLHFALVESEALVDGLQALLHAVQERDCLPRKNDILYAQVQYKALQALIQAMERGHGRVVQALLRAKSLMDVVLHHSSAFATYASSLFLRWAALCADAGAAGDGAASTLEHGEGRDAGAGAGAGDADADADARAQTQRVAVTKGAMEAEPRLARALRIFIAAELDLMDSGGARFYGSVLRRAAAFCERYWTCRAEGGAEGGEGDSGASAGGSASAGDKRKREQDATISSASYLALHIWGN
jgi:hypothetical protein